MCGRESMIFFFSLNKSLAIAKVLCYAVVDVGEKETEKYVGNFFFFLNKTLLLLCELCFEDDEDEIIYLDFSKKLQKGFKNTSATGAKY